MFGWKGIDRRIILQVLETMISPHLTKNSTKAGGETAKKWLTNFHRLQYEQRQEWSWSQVEHEYFLYGEKNILECLRSFYRVEDSNLLAKYYEFIPSVTSTILRLISSFPFLTSLDVSHSWENTTEILMREVESPCL